MAIDLHVGCSTVGCPVADKQLHWRPSAGEKIPLAAYTSILYRPSRTAGHTHTHTHTHTSTI
eukprot:822184-Pelagomonas_calceolata.AAC.11